MTAAAVTVKEAHPHLTLDPSPISSFSHCYQTNSPDINGCWCLLPGFFGRTGDKHHFLSPLANMSLSKLFCIIVYCLYPYMDWWVRGGVRVCMFVCGGWNTQALWLVRRWVIMFVIKVNYTPPLKVLPQHTTSLKFWICIFQQLFSFSFSLSKVEGNYEK